MTTETTQVRTLESLRDRVAEWRQGGATVGLVPTMGSLHEGHLSLVRLLRAKCDRLIVSIFINPAQFAPGEDFSAYPRENARDIALLAELGVELIYLPTAQNMYPEGFATRVDVAGISMGLCGTTRPHFFSGVATVVAKLFLQCTPDLAIFGEKDYQQLLVVRRMVRDLDLPIDVLSGPTVREADGLAMSTRNTYLSQSDRVIAPVLYRVISDIAEDVAKGRPIGEAQLAGAERLQSAGFEVDYLEVRTADELQIVEGPVNQALRVFVAAILGNTRLIDNVAIASP